MVTMTSAARTVSSAHRCGTSLLMSIPFSAIAATTAGLSCAAGSDPPEKTSRRSLPTARANAAAICDRPALWTHRNSTLGLKSARRVRVPIAIRDAPSADVREPRHAARNFGKRRLECLLGSRADRIRNGPVDRLDREGRAGLEGSIAHRNDEIGMTLDPVVSLGNGMRQVDVECAGHTNGHRVNV